MPAGQLRTRLRFEKRPTIEDDGFGNVEDEWEEQFELFARVRPLVGSEPVIAARLAGVTTVRMTLRSSSRSRQITTGWRAVDVHDETRIYNFTSPPLNLDEKNRWLDITAQSGVPT